MNPFLWMYGIAFFAAAAVGSLVFIFFRLNRVEPLPSFRLAQVKAPPRYFILGALGLLAIGFGFVYFFVLLVLGLAWWGWRFYPFFRDQQRLKKRIEKMNDLFPQTLGMAIQALKAGQTIPQVLEYL